MTSSATTSSLLDCVWLLVFGGDDLDGSAFNVGDVIRLAGDCLRVVLLE